MVVLYEIDLFGSKNPKLSQAVVFKEIKLWKQQEFDKKDPCEPFSECWCNKHPRECEDKHHSTPINQYVYLLFGIVIIIGYFKLKQNEKNNQN